MVPTSSFSTYTTVWWLSVDRMIARLAADIQNLCFQSERPHKCIVYVCITEGKTKRSAETHQRWSLSIKAYEWVDWCMCLIDNSAVRGVWLLTRKYNVNKLELVAVACERFIDTVFDVSWILQKAGQATYSTYIPTHALILVFDGQDEA